MIESPWRAGDAHPARDEDPGDPEAARGLLATALARLLPDRPAAAATPEARVLVLGTFGTEAVAEHLESILGRRGRDARAVAVDGDDPTDDLPAEVPVEALVVEAAGASPTAIRDAATALGSPDVVVVTAVGRDDLERLGPGRDDVVRAFASAVPGGAHVVNAEADPAIRRYLGAAVRRRGATVEHVRSHDAEAPGAELAATIDAALDALDEPPLPTEEREALVAASRPEWLRLPEGRVYDALGVTDTVAIERLRAALAGDERVSLVAALARDRRDVAAALVEYLDERPASVAGVHAVGPLSDLFAERAPVPVTPHGAAPRPDAVLEAALADGPALIVGSDRVEGASALSETITERVSRSGPARIG